MIKYGQNDTDDLKSVDPHVIQPLAYTNLDSGCNQGHVNSVLNGIQEDSDALLYSGNSDIKMEQCINLDLFLSPIIGANSANTADELNTPIFDIPKELNVINIQDNTSSDMNPFDFSVRVKTEVESDYRVEIQTDSHDTSVVNSDITDSSLLSPNNTYSMADATDGINLEEYDLLSDYNDAILLSDVFGEGAEPSTILLDVSNENTTTDTYHNRPETPENSVCSTDSPHNYALKLDVSKILGHTDELQTPDVINTIVSIEKDFNLFSFGEIVKVEDIIPSGDDNSSSITYSEVAHSSIIVEQVEEESIDPPKKFSRKRRRSSDYEDDDDEDYVPPMGKRRHKSKRSSSPQAKRGRPSKRASVSSDNSEPSKYREMRDKNNEASRKSRQKRRVQEMNCEQEREELAIRNTKLKAQVTELERTVNTFRTNLMQLLLKK